MVFVYADASLTISFRLTTVIAKGVGRFPFDGDKNVAVGLTPILFTYIGGGIDFAYYSLNEIMPYLEKEWSHPFLLLPEDISDKILRMFLRFDCAEDTIKRAEDTI